MHCSTLTFSATPMGLCDGVCSRSSVRECREDFEAETSSRSLLGNELRSCQQQLAGTAAPVRPRGACRRIVSRSWPLAPWRLDMAPRAALCVSSTRVVGSSRASRDIEPAPAALGPVASHHVSAVRWPIGRRVVGRHVLSSIRTAALRLSEVRRLPARRALAVHARMTWVRHASRVCSGW